MTKVASPMDQFIVSLYALKDDWEAMLTNPRLKFAAEAEWAIQAFTKNDYAASTTLGNKDAALNAVRNIAAVGVTLDPARKFAYILPRDSKMVLDLSYMGLMDIAISSGSLQWAQAFRVYENDTFKLSGYSDAPKHERDPFSKDRGAVVGAYVVVKTAQGDYLTSTMHIDEIHAIRARSSSWKSYLSTKDSSKPKTCPWNTDPEKMELKTVVKNAYAYWPRSDRLDQAIHYLNTDGGQGIDLPGEVDSGAKATLENFLGDIKDADSGTAVATLWHKGRAALVEFPDQLAKLREAIAARNKELGVQPPDKNGTTAPAATPEPTPAPTSAPGPKKGTFAYIAAALKDADKALNYDIFNEVAPMIDALPADQQVELNVLYNEQLAIVTKRLA
jgi:recombination protein RecT